MDGLGLCIKKIPEDTPCAGTSSQPDPPLVKTLQVDLCRLCANVPDSPIEIYNAEGITPQLSEIINEYLPVKVSPEDELSLCCCSNCASTILSFHEFALSCVEAQKRLPVAISEEPKPIPIVIPPAEPDQQMATVDDEEGQLMDDDEFNEMNEDDESEEETKLLVPGTSDDTESDLSITNEELVLKSEDQSEDISSAEEGGETPRKNGRDNLIKTKNGKALYSCDECDNISKDAKKFVIHYLSHNKDKSRIYTCEQCLQRFTQPGNLKRHIDVVHLRIRKFCCKICETTFSTKSARDDHMTAHYDGRSNVCATCDESFESKRALRNHRKCHLGRSDHSNERKTCDTCNQSFKLKQSLKRHIERKHLQLKYYCEVCKKLFTNKYNRDKHIKIHLNFCDICGKKFNDKSDLRMHKLFHA